MVRFHRPSPAMGVATVALFVALGGASVAATNDFLPKNSVGTAQIQNNSVTRAKIAHESITNALIRPGSLMASAFAANQLPSGPRGATGATGAPGAQGQKGEKGDKGDTGLVGKLTVVTRSVWVPAADAKGVGASRTVTVIGDLKEQAFAAGTSWSPDESGLLATVSIRPVVNAQGMPIGYQASGYNGTSQGHWFLLHVSFG